MWSLEDIVALIDQGRAESMAERFVDYTYQPIPPEKLAEYAAQYDGIDMLKYNYDDEARDWRFFLLEVGKDGNCLVMTWCEDVGMRITLDDDAVRSYATKEYLRDHGYPVVASVEEAEVWLKQHGGPRTPQPVPESDLDATRKESEEQSPTRPRL